MSDSFYARINKFLIYRKIKSKLYKMNSEHINFLYDNF